MDEQGAITYPLTDGPCDGGHVILGKPLPSAIQIRTIGQGPVTLEGMGNAPVTVDVVVEVYLHYVLFESVDKPSEALTEYRYFYTGCGAAKKEGRLDLHISRVHPS